MEEISVFDAQKFLQDNAKSSERMSPLKDGIYYAIKEYGEIVGIIGYKERDHTYKIDGHYVIKSYRKKGIGLFLFNYILNLLTLKPDNKDIIAFATEDSIHFYLNAGFTIQKQYKHTFLVKRTKNENIL